MRQIVQNLTVEIKVVPPKVGLLALCTRSESFTKASHQPLFKSLARCIPFPCLWWGGSSDDPAASSSPNNGEVTSWLGELHCCLIPQEGAGSANVVGKAFAGAGSHIVVDGWEEMAKRVARDMFPISNWRWYISTPQASGGRTVVLP